MGGPFDRWKIVYESRGGQPFCQKLASNLITIPFIDYIHVKWRPRRKLTRLKSGLWDEFKTNISATKPYQWECFWNSSNKRKYESIFECSTFSSITQSSEGTASRERNMIYWRIPCENLRPLAGRICEPYSWQHSLAYAATDREMYTTAKMNTHTHTHTHQPKTESDVLRRLFGSGFAGLHYVTFLPKFKMTSQWTESCLSRFTYLILFQRTLRPSLPYEFSWHYF